MNRLLKFMSLLKVIENKPVKNGNCWADSKGKYFEL